MTRHDPITRVVQALAALVACLPGISAFIAWRDGWVPVSDWSVPVILAWDTFDGHARAIGQWTSLSRVVGHDLYQPGPLQFWILAVPERLFAPSPVGALIGSALVATAAIVVLLVVAWRRGGVPMLAATTVVAALLLHGLGPELLRDPYNPAIAVLCFIGYLAAAWAVVDDDRWFLPVAVAFGSVSAQTHITLLGPLTTVGVVMVAALVRSLRSRGEGARWSRVLPTTVVVALLCWSGPLYDQFFGSGNFFRLIGDGSSTHSPAAGIGSGLRRLVDQLAIGPAWLSRAFVSGMDHQHAIPVWSVISAAFIGSIVVAGTARAILRGKRAHAALGIVALVAAAGAVFSSSRLPIAGYASQASTNRFFWWPIGALLWLMAGLTVAEVVTDLLRASGHLPRRDLANRMLVSVSALVVVLAGAVVIANANPSHDPASSSFGEVQAFTEAARPLCRTAPGPIALDGDYVANASAVGGLAAMLSLSGCEVHLANEQYFGAWRAIDGSEPVSLYISGLAQPKPGYRRIATYDGTRPPARYRTFTNVGVFMARRVVHLDVKINP